LNMNSGYSLRRGKPTAPKQKPKRSGQQTVPTVLKPKRKRSGKQTVPKAKRQSCHKSAKTISKRQGKVVPRVAPRKMQARGVREDLFDDFDLDPERATDQQHAERILQHFQTDFPGIPDFATRRCMKVVNPGITQFTKCGCLARLRQLVAHREDDEDWKIIFARIARVLRSIARDHTTPTQVSSLVQFMDEFNRWSSRQAHQNAVKAYVIKTPHASGALLMDFNGIAELGGKQHRTSYHEFYSHFLTLHEVINPVKNYVSRAQLMQHLLNALLDIFEVCKRARTHPLSPHNLTMMVTTYRRDNMYYLVERLNHDYRREAVEGIHNPFEERHDTETNLPACAAFLGELGAGLIIGHPEIPLRDGAWRHDHSDPSNPHILLRTDGTEEDFPHGNQDNLPGLLTTGDVGIMKMPDDLGDIAGKLLDRLHSLVGWDGSYLDGRRNQVFMTRQNRDIADRMGILEERIKFQCEMLSPSLLPDSYQVKIFWEASLCPAPRLNELDGPYEWAPSPQKRIDTGFLQRLEENNIKSFTGFFPLMKEGMFVEIHPNEVGAELVFVPFQKILLCPMQIPYVDGLRTSITGNPRCKFWIYLIPNTLGDAVVNELFLGHLNIPHVVGGAETGHMRTLGEFLGF
jgi:hypothetical protein